MEEFILKNAIYFFVNAGLVFLLFLKEDHFSVGDSTNSVPPDGG